jgi:hypothetical protein
LRVLYAVKQNKRIALCKRSFQQVIEFGVRKFLYPENDSLMVRVTGQFRYALADASGYGNPALHREILYLASPEISSGKHELVCGDPPGAQDFPHGVYPTDPGLVLAGMNLFHG